MVVGKMMMRWSAWSPPPPAKRRYLVRLRAVRLEGLYPVTYGDSRAIVALEVRWKGPPRGSIIPRIRRRRKGTRSSEVFVGITGNAEWIEGKESEFEKVCCFFGDGSRLPFNLWEITFSVLFGSEAPEKVGVEKKLTEVGSAVINLAQWASDFHAQKHDGEVKGEETHFHGQKKQFSINVNKDDLNAEAILHVDVSFIEIDIPKEVSQAASGGVFKSTKLEYVLDSSDSCLTDDPSSSPDIDVDASNLLPAKVSEEKNIPVGLRRKSISNHSSSNGKDSSPELGLHTVSKYRFLPWRSKSRTKMVSKEKDSKKSQDLAEEDWPIGKWESKDFISRDRQTKLKAQSFFASIDQRDESADGESACTALVAVIANALHSGEVNMLTLLKLDALIREGSSEWRRLCDNPSNIAHFPNKHFDLDTVLEAKINSLSVLPEKSFIGFFQPESFESLRGAMSFDDMWNLISNNIEDVPKVYIVSWNDHFFVLKFESEAVYIIDTLGERLSEGFRKAYILRFDESTQIYKMPVKVSKKSSGKKEEIEELICSGKDCCREFIKRFYAAIPLREELELEKKGKGNASAALHQRLQIELHYTVTCI